MIVQSQALFTIGFAALLFGERPGAWQTVGIGIATVGLLMICGTVGYDFSVGAFAILMISPLSFAAGNLLLRRAPDVPMFDLFAWLCLVAAVPLFALTLVSNGPQPTWHALTHMSLTGLICVIGLGGVSTSIAYWLWGRLLRDYPAAQVVPFALLVPFVGSAASSIVFGETVRAAAACRHGHGRRRHRRHAAVEAVRRSQKNKLCQRSREAPCRIRC